MSKMKALVFRDAGKLELTQIPIPQVTNPMTCCCG